MTEGLILVLIFVAVTVLWLDSARAREQATRLAQARCREYGFQFLDGTASVVRFGLRWTTQGVRVRRLFRFDYTETGVGRHTGHLVLVGRVVEDFSFGIEVRESGSEAVQTDGTSSSSGPRDLI